MAALNIKVSIKREWKVRPPFSLHKSGVASVPVRPGDACVDSSFAFFYVYAIFDHFIWYAVLFLSLFIYIYIYNGFMLLFVCFGDFVNDSNYCYLYRLCIDNLESDGSKITLIK